ncbi:ribosomal protein S22, S8 family [Paramyrothecium foliicola]|nr:ribosomal protein S22, S8 family [Paramyrothecium foliicola]
MDFKRHEESFVKMQNRIDISESRGGDKSGAKGKGGGDKEQGGKTKGAQSINVRHILCEKHARKEEALAQLNDGVKFDEVARNFSEDKARQATLIRGQGGSLGWKTKGSLDPAFEEVAFALEPSTTASPKIGEVKTGFGYHIIMVRTTNPSESYIESINPCVRWKGDKRLSYNRFDPSGTPTETALYALERNHPQAKRLLLGLESLTTTQEQLTTLRALPSRSRTPKGTWLAVCRAPGRMRDPRTKAGPLAELLAVGNLDQGNLVLGAEGDDQLLVGLLLALLVQDAHVCLATVERLGGFTETTGKAVVHESQLQNTLQGIENGHLSLGSLGGNLNLIGGDLGGVVLFYQRAAEPSLNRFAEGTLHAHGRERLTINVLWQIPHFQTRFENLLVNTAKMVRTSVLHDALNSINNAEKAGKRQVLIRPSSKVIVKFLQVMQRHGYIGEFEEVDDHRSGKIVVQLNGRLNKTGVISPRYNVRLADLEKWVVKLLPARQFGYVILTTSAGIMDHEEARRKHVAGKIIGFFY